MALDDEERRGFCTGNHRGQKTEQGKDQAERAHEEGVQDERSA
jgi:hypothetical protein